MNYAIILSGGIGSRLKGVEIPKQYYRVCGRMIIEYCVKTIQSAACLDGYLIVAAKEWREKIINDMRLKKGTEGKFLGFAEPGENRQLSILNALRKLECYAKECDIILIQDAVRPLTSQELILDCISAAKGAEGSMPVLKMADTVYYSSDGFKIDSLLERDKILAGQAPEAFVYGRYRQVNESLTKEELLRINGSSEPAVKAGMKIALVDGDEGNFKITTVKDLKRFERIVEEAGLKYLEQRMGAGNT